MSEYCRGLVVSDRKKKSVAEWTDEERISAAMKYATSFLGLQRLMSLPVHVPKVYDLEEYWILKAFPGGKQLVEMAIRFSRYTNMTVILSTQNPSDPEEDENDESDDVTGLFSWKIILRLDSQDQVASALKLLGMTEERAKKPVICRVINIWKYTGSFRQIRGEFLYILSKIRETYRQEN